MDDRFAVELDDVSQGTLGKLQVGTWAHGSMGAWGFKIIGHWAHGMWNIGAWEHEVVWGAYKLSANLMYPHFHPALGA